jgi:polyhydroxybutyrate depolymerase
VRRLLLLALPALALACKPQSGAPAGFRPIETGAASAPLLTEACGGGRAGATGETLTTPSGRTLHVWPPKSYEPTKPYALVFAFHGIGSSGRQFQSWFKMEDFVHEDAVVVYPDATRAWDLEGDRDLVMLDEALALLGKTYCFDRGRVLALGFSYGAKLVHHIGCKRSDRVKAIAAGDGSWAPERDCGRVPVLVTHRTRDPDELVAWGKDAARRWAEIDGCSRATEVVDERHGCKTFTGCTPANAVTWCEDTDDNPSWPRPWHHTIREEYRALSWDWFTHVR